VLTAVCTLGGVAFFLYIVRCAGFAEIAGVMPWIDWGLVAILVLSGLRFMLYAVSWRLCLTPCAALTFR